ncbi:MAG: hypothetical protein EBR07_01385 [Planctomycetes bacterium]|nr:hypothetical protein [Planctomycetota bacterium]
MAIHKLANGPITMTVASVAQKEGNFGPQYCFTGIDGTDVYVSETAGAQQLGRLNLSIESCIGATITMGQVKKDNKTFTNFALASADAAGTPAPVVNTPAPAAPKLTLDELVALYSQCVQNSVMILGAQCEAAGIPMDASAIQAGAATLFIAARGVK